MARKFVNGGSLKVTTMAFTQLFRDLYVYNFDPLTGKQKLKIPVHVSLDTKEALYEFLKYGGSHKEIDQKDTRLPRIGIQIESIAPNMDRQTGKGQQRLLYKRFNSDEVGQRFITDVKKDLQPMPFDITFRVSCWCKYMDHWAQLMENIIVPFAPSVNVGVRERGLGIERQILVRLDSVTPNNSFEVGNQGGQRIIRSEMTFTCETVLYNYLNEDPNGIINQIWLHAIDVQTPFASQTIHISGAPTETIPTTGTETTGSSGTSGV